MALYYAQQYATTKLSVGGGINNSQTTGIVVQSTTGIDTTKPGILCINWSDPLNTSLYEYVSYTSINGSNELQGVTRGVEGSTGRAHDNNVDVAWVLTESHINNLNDMYETGGIGYKQIATPSNPASGRNKLYFKNDNKLYSLSSAGTETDLASATQLNDTNGNEAIKTVATTSAVNELTVTNAATGGSPEISATGSDTNIDVKLAAKGTGVSTMVVRRQGGSATDWSSAGTTDYTEANTFIQCGVRSTPAVSTNYTVTFPVAFADKPVVTGVVSSGNVPGFTIRSITASSFVVALTGSSNASDTFHWIAIGKRA